MGAKGVAITCGWNLSTVLIRQDMKLTKTVNVKEKIITSAYIKLNW